MMRVTTSFLRGEVEASNHEQKKSFPPWKQQEGNHKQNFKKGVRNQPSPKRKQDRFTLLTKTPKEIFALAKGKFKASPPMTTPVEKRNHAKFCKFHGTEGPMIIEAKIRGRCIHRMYVDDGSASKILSEGNLSITKQIVKERIKVAINLEYPEQTTMIGSTLTEGGRNKLCDLLQRNLDIFAWKPANMTGVRRHIAEHRLNVREKCSPVRQKKRGKAVDRNHAIQEEVGNLKFKAPPLMTTPVEKQNHAKFCKFHGEVGHNTDKCMHLKKQIEEMLKVGKLSHLIKELKQNNGNEQPKTAKKGETSGKDKALAILMVQPWERNQLVPTTTLLIRFSGEIIWPIGKIQLLAKIGDEEHSTSSWMNFMVVRSPSPKNGIIRRPGVRKLHAVSSTAHGMLKLLVQGGVIILKSSRIVQLECAMVSGPKGNLLITKKTMEKRIKVAINPEYPEQMNPADIINVPRHIVKHHLNVCEGYSPVRQKKRGQAADRNQAIQEEVRKLVEAGIIKKIHYHDWLSNPIMVKKHDDSWRMCVDFKDLIKACLKYGYPLPEIDWKVESLCGFPFKCFLDAYKGYHQIQMEKEDEKNSVHYKPRNILQYKDAFWPEKCWSN
nr:reverse transcriptase domain-containing protein [Tanacetum cinerariifolium]